MKNILLKRFWNVVFIFLTVFSFAQTPPPPGEGNESGDTGGISQPIDSYTTLLLIIGIMLIITIAYTKIKQMKKI